MNNVYPPTPNSLRRRLACIFTLLSLIGGATAVANAGTLSDNYSTICETGRITVFEHEWGESYIVVAATGSPSFSGPKYPTKVQNVKDAATGKERTGTRIWYNNDMRWRDRLAFIRTAFALQQPIFITSTDGDCMGPSDEFNISLCKPNSDTCN